MYLLETLDIKYTYIGIDFIKQHQNDALCFIFGIFIKIHL
jgi:hypothetical protein